MTLLSVADSLLHERGNLERQHTGYVVDNRDPQSLDRLKVVVPGMLESEDPAGLPWAYPDTGSSTVTRPDQGEHVVPELNSLVLVRFHDGDVYLPLYSLTGPSAVTSIPLHEDFKDDWHNVEVRTWSSSGGRPNFLLFEKHTNKLHVYLSEQEWHLSVDSGGNTTVSTRGSLSVKAEDDISLISGKNINLKASGIVAHAEKTAAVSCSDFGVKARGAIAHHSEGPQEYLAPGSSQTFESRTFSSRSSGVSVLRASGAVAIRSSSVVSLDGSRTLLQGGRSVSAPATRSSRVFDVVGASSDSLDRASSAMDAIVRRLKSYSDSIRGKASEAAAHIRELVASFKGNPI